MRIAKDNHVDFVLLGGDLFHDNNPSRFTMYKTMEIFRKRWVARLRARVGMSMSAREL